MIAWLKHLRINYIVLKLGTTPYPKACDSLRMSKAPAPAGKAWERNSASACRWPGAPTGSQVAMAMQSAAPRSARCNTQDAYQEPSTQRLKDFEGSDVPGRTQTTRSTKFSQVPWSSIWDGFIWFHMGVQSYTSYISYGSPKLPKLPYKVHINSLKFNIVQPNCGRPSGALAASSWSRGSSCAGREPRHSRLKALPWASRICTGVQGQFL